MPKIQTYNSQVRAPDQTQSFAPQATQAQAQEGEAIQRFGGAAMNYAEVQQRVNVQDDTNKVYKGLEQIRDGFTQRIQDETKAGTIDPQKIQEDYQDYVAGLNDQLQTGEGKAHLDRQSSEVGSSLFRSAVQAKAHITGEKAVQDWQDAMQSSGSTLLKSPSNFDEVYKASVDNIDQSVENGAIDVATADKLKRKSGEELSKASIMGWSQLDPAIAKKKLDDNQYLSADQKLQINGEINQAQRAQDIEAERIERLQEKAQKKAQQTTQNDFLQKMQDGSLSTKDILNSNLEAFGSGSKEQFLNMQKKANEEEVKTNPAVMKDLFNKIHLPDGDPLKLTDENDLNQAFVQGKLSFADLNHLRGEVQGKGTEQGKVESDLKKHLMETAASKITKANPLLGLKDPEGDEQMQKFMSFFFSEYDKQRKAGKSATDLLNPSSKDYLGQYIPQYVRDRGQVMNSYRGKAPVPDGKAKVMGKNPQTGKIETLLIDRANLPEALKDGYQESK